MKLKLILTGLLLLSLFSLSGVNSVKGETTKNSFSKQKTTDYTIRVFHSTDCLWWIEVYSNNGDFMLEYIDPDQ